LATYARRYAPDAIKAFRQHGLDRWYGAVLVTYADDFVILCRHGAAEVLETTRRWMTGIGLTLNEDKTRLLNARKVASSECLVYALFFARRRLVGRVVACALPQCARNCVTNVCSSWGSTASGANARATASAV
jgi:hypothetical protein